jgi:hypothetical protein
MMCYFTRLSSHVAQILQVGGPALPERMSHLEL